MVGVAVGVGLALEARVGLEVEIAAGVGFELGFRGGGRARVSVGVRVGCSAVKAERRRRSDRQLVGRQPVGCTSGRSVGCSVFCSAGNTWSDMGTRVRVLGEKSSEIRTRAIHGIFSDMLYVL